MFNEIENNINQENFYCNLTNVFHQLKELQEDAQYCGWIRAEKDMDAISDEILNALKRWQEEITK